MKATFTPTGVALIFIGVLVVLALIGGGVGLGLLRGLALVDKPPPATALQATTQTPPEPRLQVDPLADRAVVVGPEKQASTYGWTNRSAGRAHVPIDVAMRMLAAQGWPNPEAGQ